MCERCKLALPANDIYIVTDYQRFAHHYNALGTQYVRTSPDCLTGTDRVREAAEHIDALGVFVFRSDSFSDAREQN